jgi:raffinose/stachyose/melibiose transport system substrate-binding protein
MNRSTWRRLGAFAVLPLIGASLAACGSDSSGGSDSKTITFAYQIANPDAKSVFATLADDYEKTHPGVTIKTNPIVLNTYGQTITTQLNAGNGPDVFFVNAGSGQAGSVTPLAEAGKLLDLTGKVNADVVPDSSKSLLYYKDELVAIPPYLAPTGLIFSPMAAEKSGFAIDSTTTMDDVIAQCGKVADGGQAIFGLAGAMAPNTAIFTNAIAAETVYGPDPTWNQERADGKTTFADSQGWKDALETMKELNDSKCFQEGAAGAGFDALTNGMGQGQMLSFSAPAGGAKDIMDSTHGAVTLTIQAMPAPSGYSNLLMTGTPDAIAGNADTKNKALVEDFLNWMTQPAQTQAAAEASGEIPTGPIDTSKLLPQYAPVADLLKNNAVAPYPYLDWPNGEVYNALGTGVTGLLTGQMSVDDVLQSMDKAWDSGS